MRELTNNEVESVSGAGFFGDMGAKVGEQVGGLVGKEIGSRFPVESIAKTITDIGSRIGMWVGKGLGNFADYVIKNFA